MAATIEANVLAEQLAERVAGESFESVRVLRAKGSMVLDSEDRPAVLIELVLEDPVGKTWPRQGILQLQRWLIAHATELRIDAGLIVQVMPETDESNADDEDAQQAFFD